MSKGKIISRIATNQFCYREIHTEFNDDSEMFDILNRDDKAEANYLKDKDKMFGFTNNELQKAGDKMEAEYNEKNPYVSPARKKYEDWRKNTYKKS